MTHAGSPSSTPRPARVAAALATKPPMVPPATCWSIPRRGVVRIHRNGRGVEVVDRVGAPLVLVGDSGPQAVDVGASAA